MTCPHRDLGWEGPGRLARPIDVPILVAESWERKALGIARQASPKFDETSDAFKTAWLWNSAWRLLKRRKAFGSPIGTPKTSCDLQNKYLIILYICILYLSLKVSIPGY
jgi:hypothetical protein